MPTDVITSVPVGYQPEQVDGDKVAETIQQAFGFTEKPAAFVIVTVDPTSGRFFYTSGFDPNVVPETQRRNLHFHLVRDFVRSMEVYSIDYTAVFRHLFQELEQDVSTESQHTD